MLFRTILQEAEGLYVRTAYKPHNLLNFNLKNQQTHAKKYVLQTLHMRLTVQMHKDTKDPIWKNHGALFCCIQLPSKT